MTKSELYEKIECLSHSYSISLEQRVGFDPFSFAQQFADLAIIIWPFLTSKIFAILFKDDFSTMVLNRNRDLLSIKFDCMHELIHYFWHDKNIYHCTYKNGKAEIKYYYEWEANEGAAEFLVPYKILIPLIFQDGYILLNKNIIIEKLSKIFKVSEAVIELRLATLEYEIYQYSKGVPLNEIELLSKRQQEIKKITFVSPFKITCVNCKAEIEGHQRYCPVCGKKKQNQFIRGDYSIMTYDKIDKSKCPKCKNENVDFINSNYCNICGQNLKNFCTNLDCEVGSLSLDSRYCYECGSESSFFKNKLLKDYNGKYFGEPDNTKKSPVTIKNHVKPNEEDDLPF